MLKIEKFTDVCMTGGMHYTPSHTNVCEFHLKYIVKALQHIHEYDFCAE